MSDGEEKKHAHSEPQHHAGREHAHPASEHHAKQEHHLGQHGETHSSTGHHSTHESHSSSQHPHHEKSQKTSSDVVNLVLVFAALAIMGIGLYFSLGANTAFEAKLNPLKEKAAEAEEAAKPVHLELITINSAQCAGACFDIAPFASLVLALEDSNEAIVTEKTLDSASPEAQALISAHKVSKLPVLIVKGETTKKAGVSSLLQNFSAKQDDNSFVFTSHQALNNDLQLGRVVGSVSIKVIKDAWCEKCWNIDQFVNGLSTSLKASSENLDPESDEAKALIEKYHIEKLPSMVMTGDLFVYPAVVQLWTQYGEASDDGAYVLTTPQPPYLDLASGEVVGLATLIRLVDASCTECYNVGAHDPILRQAFQISFKEDRNVDIYSEEGKELLAKYDLNGVPTILLSPDANHYPRLRTVWLGLQGAPAVGYISVDDWFVFTSVNLMGAYKNAKTGEVVKPQQQ